MKRYIRTKDGSIYDTTNYEQGIEQLQNLHPTEELDNFLNKEDIITESDNILDLIQVGDLVEDNSFASLQFVTSSLLSLIKDRIENYNVKTPEDLSIYKIYTKQGDDYILVWDRERGLIG